jgi:hypothetical protein
MMKRNTNEPGGLPNLPGAFGLDTLCECGEMEIYHNTFKGEDGRCDVLGSTCKQFRAMVRKPAGSALANQVQEQIA